MTFLPCRLKSTPLATSLQDVRLELAKEDAAEAAKGTTHANKMTFTTFFMTGLDLEEQQYVMARVAVLELTCLFLDVTFTSKQLR